MKADFRIPGAPIAWQRAGINRKKKTFYDPQRHIKNAMQIYLSHYEGPLLQGPQFLFVIFYMPIPKTASKKEIQRLRGTFHSLRPDSDNLEKWLNDTCQLSGNIFKDDACIAGVLKFKVWELNPQARTIFEFIPLQGKHIRTGPWDMHKIMDHFME